MKIDVTIIRNVLYDSGRFPGEKEDVELVENLILDMITRQRSDQTPEQIRFEQLEKKAMSRYIDNIGFSEILDCLYEDDLKEYERLKEKIDLIEIFCSVTGNKTTMEATLIDDNDINYKCLGCDQLFDDMDEVKAHIK